MLAAATLTAGGRRRRPRGGSARPPSGRPHGRPESALRARPAHRPRSAADQSRLFRAHVGALRPVDLAADVLSHHRPGRTRRRGRGVDRVHRVRRYRSRRDRRMPIGWLGVRPFRPPSGGGGGAGDQRNLLRGITTILRRPDAASRGLPLGVGYRRHRRLRCLLHRARRTTDARFVGTALTAQTATGFLLTVVTIQLVPVVAELIGWQYAFLLSCTRPPCSVPLAMSAPYTTTTNSRSKAMITSSTRTTPFVGQTAQLSRTVGDNDIALFTEISGDRNPLHYDEAAAKASHRGNRRPGRDHQRHPECRCGGGVAGSGHGVSECQLGAQKHPSALATQSRAASKSSRCAPTNRSPNCEPPSRETTAPSCWTEQRCATRWISAPGPSSDV